MKHKVCRWNTWQRARHEHTNLERNIFGCVRWEAGSARQRPCVTEKNDSFMRAYRFSSGHYGHGSFHATKTTDANTVTGTHRPPPHTRTHTMPRELTYTVNEFVPPRVKFLPKAAPLYRALLPFAQTRHFLSAPPVGAHILLGASLRARHRWFLF